MVKTSTSPKTTSDLESQLDALIAKVGAAPAQAPELHRTPPADEAAPPTDVVEQTEEALDRASGALESVRDIVGEPDPASATSREADDGADLLSQIDDLLANRVDEAISDEFESVDALLGETAQSGGEPENEIADATPAPSATGGAEQDAEIDGLFEAPEPSSTVEPIIEPADAPAEEGVDGGFVSLDALLDAEPLPGPAGENTPPAAGAAPATQPDVPVPPSTMKLAPASKPPGAAARLPDLLLGTCALVSKPLDRYPAEVRTSVGLCALATALPGVILIVFGLFFNEPQVVAAAAPTPSHEADASHGDAAPAKAEAAAGH